MAKAKIMIDTEMDVVVVLHHYLYQELQAFFPSMRAISRNGKLPARTASLKAFMSKGLNVITFHAAVQSRGRQDPAQPFQWLDVTAACNLVCQTLTALVSCHDKLHIPLLDKVLNSRDVEALALRAATIFATNISHVDGRVALRKNGLLRNTPEVKEKPEVSEGVPEEREPPEKAEEAPPPERVEETSPLEKLENSHEATNSRAPGFREHSGRRMFLRYFQRWGYGMDPKFINR